MGKPSKEWDNSIPFTLKRREGNINCIMHVTRMRAEAVLPITDASRIHLVLEGGRG